MKRLIKHANCATILSPPPMNTKNTKAHSTILNVHWKRHANFGSLENITKPCICIKHTRSGRSLGNRWNRKSFKVPQNLLMLHFLALIFPQRKPPQLPLPNAWFCVTNVTRLSKIDNIWGSTRSRLTKRDARKKIATALLELTSQQDAPQAIDDNSCWLLLYFRHKTDIN